jgi:glutamate synthase (NADPH/NADH) large chain
VTLRLDGDANDYAGKGLSGGRVTIRPDQDAPFAAEDQIIAGNTLLYGATSGVLHARGRVGERFAVRNSGAVAVVEGVGDHGCEYMTGGVVVVLGSTGRNFAAGMSGGRAFVWKLDSDLVNRELVDLDEPDEADGDALRVLIEAHFAETGSEVAAKLLAEWPLALDDFTVVTPREYKAALRKQAEQATADNSDSSDEGAPSAELAVANA